MDGRASLVLAGKPNVDLLKCVRKGYYFSPSKPGLVRLDRRDLRRQYPVLYPLCYEKDTSFDLGHLQKLIDALPEEFDLKVIDRNLYDACLVEEWSRDLVGNYADVEQF